MERNVSRGRTSIRMTEQIGKTGGSNKQTHGNAALSVKPPATDPLLQEVLESTARNELTEAYRLNEYFERGILPERSDGIRF